jgi:hypothetical protein
MPLRARGVMEIVDLSIRLYKQYFWILFGWSALTVLGGALLALIPLANFVTFLLTPLMVGAVVCCIAAAVRGQTVSFRQCWAFTKPRYGAMLGTYILAIIVMFAVMFLFMLGIGLLFAFGASAVFSGSGSWVMFVVIGLMVLVLSCIMLPLAVWISMVMIVVSMEDDKRSSQALGRAFQLLRGSWLKVSGLMLLMSLGAMVLLGILFAIAGSLVGITALGELLRGGNIEDSRLWGYLLGLGSIGTMVWVAFNPIFYVTLSLFYLDLRVRKEALDIEWTAHATTPTSGPREVAPFETAPSYPGVSSSGVTYPEPSSPYGTPAPSQASDPFGGLPVSGPPAESGFTPPNYDASTPTFAPASTAVPPYGSATSDTPSNPNFSAPSDYPSVSGATSPPATSPVTGPDFGFPTQGTSPARTGDSWHEALPQNLPSAPVPTPDGNAVMAPEPATRVICPNCGASVAAGRTFCMNCGAKLEQ